jgi:hypothetical protein
LDRQPTDQITKQTSRQKVFSSIISPTVKNNYQMNIFVLPNPTLNQGFKYLLTCIDIYSRYAFVKKLKSKEGSKVFEAFKEMISEEGKPKNINLMKDLNLSLHHLENIVKIMTLFFDIVTKNKKINLIYHEKY